MGLVSGIPEGVATACGFGGMALCVAAYAYSTAFTGGARQPNPYLQHGGNLAGALLLVISLLVDTNLASLVMESIWAAIGLTGLIRAIRARKDMS
jgi:hypothetical protein